MTLPFVPHSLFGRLLMALLVTTGATLLIVAALLVREWGEILTDSSSMEFTAELIAGDVDLLADLPTEESDARIRNRGDVFSFSTRGPRSSNGFRDPVEHGRRLKEQLERILGPEYPIEVKQVGDGVFLPLPRRTLGELPPVQDRPNQLIGFAPALDIIVTLPSGVPVTFRTQVPPAPPQLPLALLLQLLLVTLVLGAVLYWTARTITRPLRELEAAAETVGRGARFALLRESGARELRSATRAFNAMQERLHRYLDSRTRVLSAMSHDLRTPLTRLRLRVESIEDEQLRARVGTDLDEMEQLVTSALNLFKGVDHDEPLEPIRIGDLLALLAHEFTETGAQVTVSGNATEPIGVRRRSLKRCLTNLIANAVKYGGRADVIIADDANGVIVRIQDEGPGIPEPMLEKVFEPFFRLEPSRSTETGGTGLGLSIARDVAQAHGGSLLLRNRSPRGLEAVLRLPRFSAR